MTSRRSAVLFLMALFAPRALAAPVVDHAFQSTTTHLSPSAVEEAQEGEKKEDKKAQTKKTLFPSVVDRALKQAKETPKKTPAVVQSAPAEAAAPAAAPAEERELQDPGDLGEMSKASAADALDMLASHDTLTVGDDDSGATGAWIDASSIDTESAYPGVDYLGMGYDLVNGNPAGSAHTMLDPGFRAPVRRTSYKALSKTRDNQYFTPDGSISKPLRSCTLSTQYTDVATASKYAFSLAQDVSVETSYKHPMAGVAFKGSWGMKNARSMERNAKEFRFESTSYCEKYHVQWMPGIVTDPNLLMPQFLEMAWKALAATDWAPVDKAATPAARIRGRQAWRTLFKAFGTHYIDELVLGGKMIAYKTMSRSTMSEAMAESKDLTAQLGVQGEVFGGTANFNGGFAQSSSTQSSSQEASLKASISVVVMGGDPGENDVTGIASNPSAFGEWATTVTTNPMPIRYRLKPLSDLAPAFATYAQKRLKTEAGSDASNSSSTSEEVPPEEVEEEALEEALAEGGKKLSADEAPIAGSIHQLGSSARDLMGGYGRGADMGRGMGTEYGRGSSQYGRSNKRKVERNALCQWKCFETGLVEDGGTADGKTADGETADGETADGVKAAAVRELEWKQKCQLTEMSERTGEKSYPCALCEKCQGHPKPWERAAAIAEAAGTSAGTSAGVAAAPSAPSAPGAPKKPKPSIWTMDDEGSWTTYTAGDAATKVHAGLSAAAIANLFEDAYHLYLDEFLANAEQTPFLDDRVDRLNLNGGQCVANEEQLVSAQPLEVHRPLMATDQSLPANDLGDWCEEQCFKPITTDHIDSSDDFGTANGPKYKLHHIASCSQCRGIDICAGVKHMQVALQDFLKKEKHFSVGDTVKKRGCSGLTAKSPKFKFHGSNKYYVLAKAEDASASSSVDWKSNKQKWYDYDQSRSFGACLVIEDNGMASTATGSTDSPGVCKCENGKTPAGGACETITIAANDGRSDKHKRKNVDPSDSPAHKDVAKVLTSKTMQCKKHLAFDDFDATTQSTLLGSDSSCESGTTCDAKWDASKWKFQLTQDNTKVFVTRGKSTPGCAAEGSGNNLILKGASRGSSTAWMTACGWAQELTFSCCADMPEPLESVSGQYYRDRDGAFVRKDGTLALSWKHNKWKLCKATRGVIDEATCTGDFGGKQDELIALPKALPFAFNHGDKNSVASWGSGKEAMAPQRGFHSAAIAKGNLKAKGETGTLTLSYTCPSEAMEYRPFNKRIGGWYWGKPNESCTAVCKRETKGTCNPTEMAKIKDTASCKAQANAPNSKRDSSGLANWGGIPASTARGLLGSITPFVADGYPTKCFGVQQGATPKCDARGGSKRSRLCYCEGPPATCDCLFSCPKVEYRDESLDDHSPEFNRRLSVDCDGKEHEICHLERYTPWPPAA